MVLDRVRAVDASDVRLVICDLSASPYVDLGGSRMLHELHGELAARGAVLRIVGAHGWARDLLRADGIAEKVGGLDRVATLDGLLGVTTRRSMFTDCPTRCLDLISLSASHNEVDGEVIAVPPR